MSLLLTSLVPLGSTGEVIWLPPNFEVQVVSGRFVSTETYKYLDQVLDFATEKDKARRFYNPQIAMSQHCLLPTAGAAASVQSHAMGG